MELRGLHVVLPDPHVCPWDQPVSFKVGYSCSMLGTIAVGAAIVSLTERGPGVGWAVLSTARGVELRLPERLPTLRLPDTAPPGSLGAQFPAHVGSVKWVFWRRLFVKFENRY